MKYLVGFESAKIVKMYGEVGDKEVYQLPSLGEGKDRFLVLSVNPSQIIMKMGALFVVQEIIPIGVDSG